MAIQTLTIPATCPEDSAEGRGCDLCVRQRLMATPGVRKISLSPSTDNSASTTLELDYDPSQITLTQLDAEMRSAGLCLRSPRAQVILDLEGMVSPRSEHLIESVIGKLPGVVAQASFASETLRVEFDRSQCALPEIVRRLGEIGFRLRRPKKDHFVARGEATTGTKPDAATSIAPARWRVTADFLLEHRQLALAAVGAVLLLTAVITRFSHGPAALRYSTVALGFVLAGWYTAIDTFKVLRQFRFDIDVLMFAAAFGAASLGHFEEGCFLLVLFAFGGAGEELAMDRARRAIEALAKLAPDTATIRDPDGRERLVRVEELKLNDQVLVRPFDRVPADGVVHSGTSAIDQSPITGESVPVEKTAGASVFAGSINGEGLLVVAVSKLAGESTLAKIVKMVNEAQTTKSPTQLFTDRVEHWYVPLVLIATGALIVLPPLLGDGHWGLWFYRSMAFLTAASPCALAIGTPAAVLSGIARAARLGVLVKGGVHLENLGKVNVLAFDKTGTLTRGRPEVTEIVVLDSAFSEDQLLALAAAAEKTSTHPLATAIVNQAMARNLSIAKAEEVQQVSGQGLSAVVEGRRIVAGRIEMIDAAQHEKILVVVLRLSEQGNSSVVIGIDGIAAGVIALADRERENASATLRRLKALGIKKCIMLTGDRSAVAQRMGERVGVDEVHAELLPQDKLDRVADLQRRYGPIAMVGDGVNDAPAMASATVGIAMGAGGTDVAIETADIALMADDLSRLPTAIELSRFSRRIIRQNLVIALGVIMVLAPLSALGYTYLGVAVLFHEGSTVVVVLNAMRLLVFKPGAVEK